MKYKLILQATLCIGISASMLISSSIVQAQTTRFRGLSSQSEYFHRDGTIFYLSVTDSNLRSYCGFTSPGHLDAYRSVIPGNVNYRNPPSNTGRYEGPCAWPDGFYKLEGAAPIYYLSGNWQSACWVRSFERLAQLGGSGRVRTVNGLSKLFIGRSYSERC